MADNVLTFYSIGGQEVDFLDNELAKSGFKGEGYGKYTGETPLGEVAAEIGYNKPSGQLTVTVTKKPFILTMDTIKAHIQTALTNARIECEKRAAAKVTE